MLALQTEPQRRDAIAAALRQALGLVHEPAPHVHEPAPHDAASPCTSMTCSAPHLLPPHLDLGNPVSNFSTPPVLHQILPRDLTQLDRLHALYQQATARWHLPRGQRHWENFVALACLARRGRRNPGAYLYTLVRKGNWGEQITQEAEEEAQRWLKGQVA
jgi:hypothetical protein